MVPFRTVYSMKGKRMVEILEYIDRNEHLNLAEGVL